MVLEDENASENRKLRKLEDQKLGGPENCQPSYLPTFLPFPFLLSYFLKMFVVIRGFPYPLSSFLFPISILNVLVFGA